MIEKNELLKLLDDQGIDYKVIEHPAVHTIEEMDDLGLSRNGVIAKNLFLRDAKGKRHFLVILRGNRQVDLKELQRRLDAAKLSFASDDRLKKHLGVEKGSVTPFGVLNNEDREVEVFIDKDLAGAPAVGFHPNDNTATVFLSLEQVVRIVREHGNPVTFIDII